MAIPAPHHAHDVRPDLPLSVMAQSAIVRVGAVLFVLIGLWLAVWWAAALA